MGNPASKHRRLPLIGGLAVAALLLAGCRGATAAEEPVTVPTRAADATVTVDQVKVELWATDEPLVLGRSRAATGRVTNLGQREVWYEGKPCAQSVVGLVRFPAFDAPGRRFGGVAGRVKAAWVRGDGTAFDRYTRPDSNIYFGVRDVRCSHAEEQEPPMSRLGPGQSLALDVAGVPDWTEGDLPGGGATVGVIFSFGPSERFSAEEARVAYASIPVPVSGGSRTVSPAEALDAALAAEGVPAYLAAHADDTQLTASPRLSAREWTVSLDAVDVAPGRKSVAPTLEVVVDRASGRVLSVR